VADRSTRTGTADATLNAAVTRSTPLLVSEPEAARLLGVSARTVWQLRADGKLPGVKIGSAVRYDPEDLRRFIASAKTGGEA
jgi:excisionase family DNA binding protein